VDQSTLDEMKQVRQSRLPGSVHLFPLFALIFHQPKLRIFPLHRRYIFLCCLCAPMAAALPPGLLGWVGGRKRGAGCRSVSQSRGALSIWVTLIPPAHPAKPSPSVPTRHSLVM
jgi:hypothetical protein